MQSGQWLMGAGAFFLVSFVVGGSFVFAGPDTVQSQEIVPEPTADVSDAVP